MGRDGLSAYPQNRGGDLRWAHAFCQRRVLRGDAAGGARAAARARGAGGAAVTAQRARHDGRGGVPTGAARELTDGVTAEGTAVLDAAGIGYATPAEIQAVRGDHVDFGPVTGIAYGGGSSWQSLSRGTGSIEADFLNGEIVLLGREHGIPTPVNELLQRETNAAAQANRPPRSMAAEDLVARLARPSRHGQ